MWDEIFETPEDTSDKQAIKINDVDRLAPEAFEKLIAVIYRKQGYQAELTPHSSDQGADVVALAHGSKAGSFLAQCKHTINPNKAQGSNGVQEILAAYGVYKKYYSVAFEKVVFTNSERYTSQTVQIASDNEVILKCRKDVSNLIEEHNISFEDLV
jgi:restriction system protein